MNVSRFIKGVANMKDEYLGEDDIEYTELDESIDAEFLASITEDLDIDADELIGEDFDLDISVVGDEDFVISEDEDIVASETKDEIEDTKTKDKTKDKGEGEDEDGKEDASKVRMELYDWLQCIVSAIICGIFIFVFVGRTISVDGRSMLDTLHDNDRVIMTNLFYAPKNGDIVVFRSPADMFGGTPLVKRVIAIAGQEVNINFDTGEVFVNGNLLDEPYIREITTNRIDFAGPVTVPEGYIFVMGDNRNSSSDSRDSRVGFVDTRYILGKVLLIAIPGEDETTPRDWGRFGFVH